MAKISILDTGYLTPTNTGTRLSSDDMANAGAEVTLKAATFKLTSSQEVDSSPALGIYGAGTSIDSAGVDGNVAVVNPVTFSLNGVLDSLDATDQGTVLDLVTLPLTKGYKVIYYNSSTDDKENQLIYQLATDTFSSGEASAFSVTEGWRHIHVRISKCDLIEQAGMDKWNYIITGIVIKKETSTV